MSVEEGRRTAHTEPSARWIPAFAGMRGGGECARQCPFPRPAWAPFTGWVRGVSALRAEGWIPAFARMTDEVA